VSDALIGVLIIVAALLAYLGLNAAIDWAHKRYDSQDRRIKQLPIHREQRR
jgi:hypothetical protein